MSTYALVCDGPGGPQVFVYVRGVLVMKRWLRTGVDVTFHHGLTRWSTENRDGSKWLGEVVV